MMALQRKFVGEHKRELHPMKLSCRAEKANKSLQDFAMEGERLVKLTYLGEKHLLVDNFQTEAFVNRIQNPDIKLAVCSVQKANFERPWPSRSLARFHTTSKQSAKNGSGERKTMPFAQI